MFKNALILSAILAGFVVEARAGTIVNFEFKNFGSVQVELFNTEAPLTVANFLNYVTAGRYNNTMIHRVDTSLGVVQGGGFKTSAAAVATVADPMIPLEYSHPNARGTLAMARGANVNSATSQWYFNTHDNSTLLGPSNGGGYAVFGQVLGNGMAVIDAMAAVQTFPYGSPFNQVPLQNFSIADFSNSVDPLPHVVALNAVSVVPEPSTFVLAVLGLIGLVVWRRRKR
jgi:cyclophilin family peptidyl-prolyl cis-trans isomerase